MTYLKALSCQLYLKLGLVNGCHQMSQSVTQGCAVYPQAIPLSWGLIWPIAPSCKPLTLYTCMLHFLLVCSAHGSTDIWTCVTAVPCYLSPFPPPSPHFAARVQRCHNLTGEVKHWDTSPRKHLLTALLMIAVNWCSRLDIQILLECSPECSRRDGSVDR